MRNKLIDEIFPRNLGYFRRIAVAHRSDGNVRTQIHKAIRLPSLITRRPYHYNIGILNVIQYFTCLGSFGRNRPIRRKHVGNIRSIYCATIISLHIGGTTKTVINYLNTFAYGMAKRFVTIADQSPVIISSF